MVRKQVRSTIEKHGLISPGDHIVMGLSGGPDSMCLFDVLLAMAEEFDLTVYPVHVNHKFRPGAAEEDQKFVEETCERIAETNPRCKPCRSFVVDCNALADELGMTSEEAGRRARYDAFGQVAAEIMKDSVPVEKIRIAVAQNADDQAETVLFRILRGTGTDGLAGIAYERKQKVGEEGTLVSVIRPLLDMPRTEIEAYCEENALNPVTDHTNSEPIYARNRIRLELLPYLERYNENIRETLSRLAGIAAEDRSFFREETEKAFAALTAAGRRGVPDWQSGVYMDREALAELHPALRHRILIRAFAEIGLEKDITAERLEAADEIILKKQGPKTVEFPRGYRVTVAKGKVCVDKD